MHRPTSSLVAALSLFVLSTVPLVSLMDTGEDYFDEKDLFSPSSQKAKPKPSAKVSAPSSLSTPKEMQPFYHFETYLKHREGGGIGYSKGYSSLEAFLGFGRSERRSAFIDLRGHVFNSGTGAGNMGIGYRSDPWDGSPYLFGVNGYYDVRFSNGVTINQLGAGFEFFSDVLNLTLNGYLPCSHTDTTLGYSTVGFSGHRLMLDKRQQLALAGGDLTFFRNIYCHPKFSLSGSIGTYYFYRDTIKTNLGFKANLGIRALNCITLEGDYSYDRLYKNRFQGMIALHVPFGPDGKANRQNATECPKKYPLYSPPMRSEIIPVKKRTKEIIARNKAGNPIYFYHVDNLGTSYGDGTIENPNTSLAAAHNASPADAIIYVHYGNGSAYQEGIEIHGDQKLFGSSLPEQIPSRYGTITVPALTPGLYPIITNNEVLINEGSAIKVGNESNLIEIAGLVVEKAAGYGIKALNGGNQVYIHNCQFFDNTLELHFENGTTIMENCFVAVSPTNNATNTLYFINNFTLTGNTIVGPNSPDQSAIAIIPSVNATSITFTISGNNIYHPQSQGISMASQSSAVVFENCVISNNFFDGVSTAGNYYCIQLQNNLLPAVANTYTNLQIISNTFVNYANTAILIPSNVVNAASASGLIEENIFKGVSVTSSTVSPLNGGGLTVEENLDVTPEL